MKYITGFEGMYSACSDGRIWSHKRGMFNGKNLSGKWLKPYGMARGYQQVMLYGPGRKCRKYLVHRLIAQTFIPNPNSHPQVNHKNGLKDDNRVENLEWCTAGFNSNHAAKNGLMPRAEAHFGAKITTPVAWAIRILASEGVPQKRIAAMLKLSQSSISDIVRGNAWLKHKPY